MIEFHELTLSDGDLYRSIQFSENTRSADFGFGNLYMWDKRYKQLLCPFGGRMLTKLKYESLPFFAFPIGAGPLRPAILAMKEYADRHGFPLRLNGITEKNYELMQKEFPGEFLYCEEERFFDYIYSIESLATLSGKKLHGKKNHCNRFEAENNWEFVPLTAELIPQCAAMLDRWTEENATRLQDGISDEHEAIMRGFEHFDALRLEGGVLRVDGSVAGFTVGEVISEDTVDVHFEKAFTDINGSYTMVCREFARMIMAKHPNIKYLNREDDMGNEALRKSKESYRPEYLLKKYSARFL